MGSTEFRRSCKIILQWRILVFTALIPVLFVKRLYQKVVRILSAYLPPNLVIKVNCMPAAGAAASKQFLRFRNLTKRQLDQEEISVPSWNQ